MHLYVFLVHSSFALIVCAGAPWKSTQESFWSIKTNKIMTWNTIISLLRWIYLFWDSQNSLECAPSIIIIAVTHFIAISRRSVNKLSAQLISYLHVVIMRGFTSLQNSAPDKNSPFWAVSEHLTLSITQTHTDAFAKYVSPTSDGAPDSPGP